MVDPGQEADHEVRDFFGVVLGLWGSRVWGFGVQDFLFLFWGGGRGSGSGVWSLVLLWVLGLGA